MTIELTAAQAELFEAVYYPDAVKNITAYFFKHTEREDCLRLCDLLIDACYERVQNPPFSINDTIIQRENEIAMRRDAIKLLPHMQWVTWRGLTNEYLSTFTRAAFQAKRTRFDITASDFVACNWKSDELRPFNARRGNIRVQLQGAALDVHIRKERDDRTIEWHLQFERALLMSVQSRAIRTVRFDELVFPNHVHIEPR